MTSESFTPSVDEVVAHNARFAAEFDDADLQASPVSRLAVVACMDARIDVHESLGIRNGEAHVIRNAGGVVTDDVIRSLCLSQRTLGTREILLLHHTDCGLQKVDEISFRAGLEADLGVTPSWALESFTDPYADVRQSLRRLHMTPFVPYKEHIRGFVYDVTSGGLHEVGLSDP